MYVDVLMSHEQHKHEWKQNTLKEAAPCWEGTELQLKKLCVETLKILIYMYYPGVFTGQIN